MSKTADERDWYLSRFAPAGWQADRMCGIKKWEAHRARLLKDGHLEKDPEYEMYRITDKGVERIRSSSYRHMLPPGWLK